MKREMIICIVIIVFIVILDIITQNNTYKTMDEITTSLNTVRHSLEIQDDTALSKNMESIINNWKEKSDILSFYVEHDELEKVGMYLQEIDSNIETKEYNIAIQSLDTCNFIIEHIKDKYKVSLKNIF